VIASRLRVLLGLSGLGVGALSFVLAAYDLVALLSHASYLLALYWAIAHARMHVVSDADRAVFAQFAAALFAVAGTGALALLLAYLGVPLRIKPVPAVGGASSGSIGTKATS